LWQPISFASALGHHDSGLSADPNGNFRHLRRSHQGRHTCGTWVELVILRAGGHSNFLGGPRIIKKNHGAACRLGLGLLPLWSVLRGGVGLEHASAAVVPLLASLSFPAARDLHFPALLGWIWSIGGLCGAY